MRQLYTFLLLFGFDGKKLFQSLNGLPKYFNDLKQLKKLKAKDSTFFFAQKFPVLNEWYEQAGTASGHYFHQDLYVAQKIFKNNPARHIDVGSRIDGFVAHVASFREIEVLDIREVTNTLENITFKKADVMLLQDDLTEATDSLSCLHALEHFGLGRYGDPIDYFGYLKGLRSITKMLKKGGRFYFSVPIGKQRIEFNAHRVFSISYLLEILSVDYKIDCFSFVDDKGDFFKNQLLTKETIHNNFNCHYGCGIFELIRL